MESDAAYRREIFENVLDAVIKHARDGEIDVVKGDGTEFTVKRLSPPVASATAYLLPDEPSFLVNFDFGSPYPSLSNVTFTVSERDYDRLYFKTSRPPFASVDEAAGWLIDSLSLPVSWAELEKQEHLRYGAGSL